MRQMLMSAIVLLSVTLIQGCSKSSGEDESKDENISCNHYITIRSFDVDNKEITGSGSVKEVTMYIFDQNGAFISAVDTKDGAKVPLNYKQFNKITVVAWGNTKNDKHTTSELLSGNSVNNAYVSLVTTDGYSTSSDDLFFGRLDVDMADGSGDFEHQMPIKRKSSGVSIAIKGIETVSPPTVGDYWFVVDGGRKYLDFNGSVSGDAVRYRQIATINSEGVLTSKLFYTYPSVTPITVYVYKGTSLIYVIQKGSKSEALTLPEGRVLNVAVELLPIMTGNLAVHITFDSWYDKLINEEF